MGTLFKGCDNLARFAISVEGAASMRTLANQLLLEANAIYEASIILEKTVMAESSGLGIYQEEIIALIQHGRNSLNASKDDTIALAQQIQSKAQEIEELVALNLEPATGAATSAGITGDVGGSVNGAPSMKPTRSSPRDLAASQYAFAKDSDGNLIYDSPNEMNQYLYTTQGSAYPSFQGTCGLCSCANILRLSGVNATEKDMVDYASVTRDTSSFFGKLCATGHIDPGHNGGTSPKSRQQILNHFGIDSGIFPVAHNEDGTISDSNLNQIADYVSSGRGVILSVHADVLWNDAAYGFDDYHAVTVTSVKKNSAGEILGFYICDSAQGGTTYYPAEKVKRALTGAPMNVTYPIIR